MYKESALKLYQNILSTIRDRLGNSNVFGRKKGKHFWHEVNFYVSDRLVTVYYRDDTENKIRWIERVGIDRKPIIF